MADPIYGNTFAEDFAARRRMLPQAMGAMPMQRDPVNDLLAELNNVQRRRAELEGQQPDMSAMQEFARRQGEMGQNALLNAIAAQYAGEAFQPLQAKFLKQAEAAQQPIRMGSGMLTPTGEFIRDPEAAQERQLAGLNRREAGLRAELTQRELAASRAEEARLRREADDRFRQMGFDIKREIAANRAASAGGADETRNFTRATSLRGEVTRRADKIQEGTRQAETVLTLLNDPSIAKDPTKQVSLVFAFGKMLDPESVVRESEYALISNARGAFDSILQKPEQIKTGARLTPQQLDSMRQVANQLFAGSSQRRNDLYDYYRGIASRNNLRVEDVLPMNAIERPSGGGRVVDFNQLPR
jgi:hypothetical protein